MNREFLDKVKKLIKNDENLFYNSSGNQDAYKLFVRHISYAPSLNKAIRINNFIHPIESIKLVDFEKEEIFETEDKIKIIPIQNID